MTCKYSLAGAIALIMATPAWAQSPSGQVQPPAAPSKTGAAPAAPQALAEVVVTAEHRSESVQKIPLAVTVISGDMLSRQNIDSPSGLQTLVPGLKILEIGVQPSIFIRGIGGAVANVLNDPAAAYNLDGVAISRPIAINGLFFDLERAEVLKGPQGTLYGGNSTVGAINIVSQRPKFEFGGSAGVTFGNYNTVKTDGVINVPVGDTLALRASFQTNKHDGYISNGSDDADDVGVRVKALYEPSNALTALLTATYFHSGGVGPGDVPLKSASGGFLDPSHPWRVTAGPDLDNGGLAIPTDGHQDLKTKTVSAQIDWKASVATLTVTPSYIDTDYSALAYDGGFSKKYRSYDHEASIETRLASNADSASHLKWQVGGLYQDIHQVTTVFQHINGSPPGPELYQNLPLDLTTTSWGLFGQGTYSLSSAFRVTGGVRYTNDHKNVVGTSTTLIGGAGGPIINAYPSSGTNTWSNVDYRVGFDFDLAPTSLIYGNISTGYKTGGINTGLAPNSYKPEHLTSYQVGSKNAFFDRKLQVNLEVWYWDYRDFQVQQFVPINTAAGPNTGADFGSTNAKKAMNYGLESQVNWIVTSNDRISLNLQYDVAKYVDFIQTTIFPVFATANYHGQTVPFAPVYSGNITGEHTFDLGAAGSLVASVNDHFTSAINIVLQKIPGQQRGGTNVTDMQLTYHAMTGKWELGAYVNNVQNEPVIVFAGATPAGLWGHPGTPRTFGVRASAKF